MKYPPDWKYEEDVMNCPVVFYNEKYPKRLPQGMDIDRNASISFCLTNTFLTPYSASQFIERFTGDKETILIGSSNVGVFSESPGLFLASFINWRDLYNLTMIPLVWNNEQGVREGFNDTERAELREVFMAIASTIEN